MFERFNTQARQSVVHAQEEAQRLNQHYIGTEHLLLGVLDVDGSVAAEALAALSVSPDDVRRDVEAITGRGEELAHGSHPLHSPEQASPGPLSARGDAAQP